MRIVSTRSRITVEAGYRPTVFDETAKDSEQKKDVRRSRFYCGCTFEHNL